jgi:hypothetical protein
MAKGIFNKLALTKTFKYDIFGADNEVEFTYSLLRNKHIVEFEQCEPPSDAGFLLILRSIEDNIDDAVTLDDVKELPIGLTEKMLEDIFEFNNIDISKFKQPSA